MSVTLSLPAPGQEWQPQGLLDALADFGLAVKTHSHPPFFTVQEGQALKATLPGGHSKNLFMTDGRGTIVLISALSDSALKLNRLHRVLGCSRLSFGTPELLYECLKVRPGSVTGFALVHDRAQRVRYVLEAAFMAHQTLNFHPLRNDMTTAIARDDFVTFLRALGREPEIVDFSRLHDQM
jgi:Ala-tRNA(Pro) deacylase